MQLSAEQVRRAEGLLAMHHGRPILVLPNAWDAASARLFAASGARAIGTTSMGIAASAGFGDVQRLPFERMLDAIEQIAAAVDVPVSADMEAGWGDTPDAAARSIARALERGAVGVNLEDGTGDPGRPLSEPEVLADKIAAVRAAARAAGMHVVINARTDVFLRAVGPPGERLAEVLRRGHLYRDAGADCIFVPGGLEPQTIDALVRGLEHPLNVLANPATAAPGAPPVAELEALGVARVSVGSGPMRATLAFTQRVARELLQAGTYDLLASALLDPAAPAAYRDAIGGSENER